MEGVSNNYSTHGLRWNTGQPQRRGNYFYRFISTSFGHKYSLLLKKWTKLMIQLATANAKRLFLVNCRYHDVYPPHISRMKLPCYYLSSSNFIREQFDVHTSSFKDHLVNLEIQDIHIFIDSLHKILNGLKCSLVRSHIPFDTLDRFFDFTNNKCTRIFNSKIQNLHKKFDFCLRSAPNIQIKGKSDWVKNLSSISLPQEVIDVISLGPKFNIPSSDITNNDILTSVKNLETGLSRTDLDLDTKNDIRQFLVNTYSCKKGSSKHIPLAEREFSKKLSITKSFLKNNSDSLLITRADKGNLTVCMSKSDYLEKMNGLLNDEATYKPIKRNPLSRIQKSVHKILSDLNYNDFLSFKYNDLQLTQTDTSLAKAYGLPKIHKQNNPLRPVISTIGSPLHFLSKTLYNDLFQAIPIPQSHVNNSFELKNKLHNITVPDGYTLLSLDVSSMFTNITCQEVLKSLDRRVSHIRNKCKIPFEKIRDIVIFIFSNMYFTFDDQIFQQKSGSPMGLSLSPLFADIVMDDLETDCLFILKNQHNCIPLFYYRYVDDTLICVKKEDIDIVLSVFNNHNPSLKFTSESENNNSINFLDLTLTKVNNKIITNWYIKPSNSSRLLNYNSNHSIQLKKNIIYNLTDRAISLSNKQFHSMNLNIITDLLKENDYPPPFIESCISYRLRKIFFSQSSISPESTFHNNSRIFSNTISLPFNNNAFFKSKNFLKEHNISVVPHINRNLSHIITLGKDRTKKEDTTGTVYKFDCKECPATYIGETKRPLKIRLREHMTNKDRKSVVALHIQNHENHSFDWNNARILDREKNYHKRKLSESIHINCFSNTINKKEDTQFLNRIYRNILKF